MDERLLKINSILNGSSSRLRESFFQKNHTELFNEINKFCENISDLPFTQKIWHWVNDVDNYFLCGCGNKIKFNKNWLDGYRKGCSPKCSQNNESTKNKRKETNLLKYGVENVAKLEEVRHKTIETNLKKWGTEFTSQNLEVKKKYKKTCLDKWGVQNFFETEEFKELSKETNLRKWGKEHFVQTEQYLTKSKETNLEKYGVEWFSKSEDFISKTIKTNNEKFGKNWYVETEEFKLKLSGLNLNKWGVEHFFKTEEFKNLSKETNLRKWGTEYYSQSSEWKEHVKSPEFSNKIIEGRKKFYAERGFKFISNVNNSWVVILQDINNCGHQFQIHPTTLQRRRDSNIIVCTICNPINSSQSGQELNLIEFIQSLGEKVEIKNRSILGSLELDIFLPEKNLALEYNGLYWHSEIYKNNDYHLKKSIGCQNNQIDLIHIWEDDWLNKEEIVKSIILNKLNRVRDKIYARKCRIVELSNNETINFLNQNHIQGHVNSSKSIGLVWNDELVSLMSFNSKNRSGILEWELIRFCNKIKTNVVGGASKLFKYFIDNYNPNKIISFADRSIFSGDLYKKLGFQFSHRTEFNYWWVVDGIRRHRFSFNKKKLVKWGFDPSKTEVQIMHELGNYRIYGCGQDKWIWWNNKEM